jgi:hypothetical protein
MGLPKMPSVPAPVTPPPPPAQSQLSSSAVLGSVENTQLAAQRAAGRGFGGTLVGGATANPAIDLTKTKPQLIGAGLTQ